MGNVKISPEKCNGHEAKMNQSSGGPLETRSQFAGDTVHVTADRYELSELLLLGRARPPGPDASPALGSGQML